MIVVDGTLLITEGNSKEFKTNKQMTRERNDYSMSVDSCL